MARVICPFCLKSHDFVASLICPTHNEPVPAAYIKDYHKVPPLWLVTVGFSNHGKTTYLAALTLMLENISAVWPGVYYRPLDQYTMDEIKKMRAEAKVGKTPGRTVDEAPRRPLLFNIFNLPEGGSRCLIMYDVRGEIYNSLDAVQKYVTPIKEVNTIWFLVSLDDLDQDTEGKTITDLFNVYWTGMQSLRVDLKDRNLIVIYTKGDKAVFPAEIKQYLLDDPLKGLTHHDFDNSELRDFSLHNYMEKLRAMSNQIEDHTRRRGRGGGAFINMVRASGINLIFSITSAIGQDPNATSNYLVENALRYRVLDPFLWAIMLDRPVTITPIKLIVDASARGRTIFDQGLLTKAGERLLDYGELTVFYLGQTVPAVSPGQSLPSSPPRIAHHSLIGPILEQLAPDSLAIVITADSILDLEDFHDSTWQKRLLLVTMDEDSDQMWPHKVIYHPDDDPWNWVDQLLNI